MLSMLGSVKVLVSKDNRRDYRGARVKRTTVTVIECITVGSETSFTLEHSYDFNFLDPHVRALA